MSINTFIWSLNREKERKEKRKKVIKKDMNLKNDGYMKNKIQELEFKLFDIRYEKNGSVSVFI